MNTAPPLPHADAARNFLKDEANTDWHNQTLWFVRTKRDKAAATVPGWEALREAASRIKDHTLSQLGFYLEAFEKHALANGVQVHWAADADEHNRLVLGIMQQSGATRMVKSKSMLTEECHLNPFLEQHGIEVIDTDLGERIVQLRQEPPSHIVMPAIHLRKQAIGELFHEKLGTAAGASDPQYLAEAARQHLRQKFLGAEVALTGVNFAIAETGGFVVCTNEGNADLGVHLAHTHIASMGIEKVIPRQQDLAVFLRLLARSATGQAITTYSSFFRKPAPGQQLHIILVDNGRTRQLADPDFRNSLKCIRCGACMNTCPVYRRSGGHSYHNTVPGPIGSILAPNIDKNAYSDLPFASTLCGSCSNVCPVRIDIHRQLYVWRQRLADAGAVSAQKRFAMQVMAQVLGRPGWYGYSGRVGRRVLRWLPGLSHNARLNAWAIGRQLPEPPTESFRDWYARTRGTSPKNHSEP